MKRTLGFITAALVHGRALARQGEVSTSHGFLGQRCLPSVQSHDFSSSSNTETSRGTKSLYVLNVEGRRTLGPLLIGLMDYFQRWLPNVGFFQVRALTQHTQAHRVARDALRSKRWNSTIWCATPCMPATERGPCCALDLAANCGGALPRLRNRPQPPRHVELMHSAFNIGDPLDAMWALTRRELVAMLAHDKLNDVLDAVYTKFEQNRGRHDLWLIEGTHEGVPTLARRPACVLEHAPARLRRMHAQHRHAMHTR